VPINRSIPRRLIAIGGVQIGGMAVEDHPHIIAPRSPFSDACKG
jgi:hypothetical protein